jgi:hypothetical protein
VALEQQTPWHQRIALVARSRAWARAKLFDTLRAVAQTDDGRRILAEALGDLADWRPASFERFSSYGAPYPDLATEPRDAAAKAKAPIFVTGRFRSGSTLLWNLFRAVDGCTAYYEPFNERRWFDPQTRGTHVDPTHRHVSDYAREYVGLEELDQYYSEEWTRRGLYMDERSWNPAMSAYVRLLIDRAPGRPILQFNRIDFRLPWFRANFPDATIVHLYRHPREQWCSSLTNLAACSQTCDLTTFRPHDGFYLLSWAEDLKYRFPFLDCSATTHPYRVFYAVWKLSYLYGIKHATYSMSYEALTQHPEVELDRLFLATGIVGADIDRLMTLVEPSRPRWSAYADAAWFKEHEEAVDRILDDFVAAERHRPAQAHSSDAPSGQWRRAETAGHVDDGGSRPVGPLLM